jgi:hypothetical protein
MAPGMLWMLLGMLWMALGSDTPGALTCPDARIFSSRNTLALLSPPALLERSLALNWPLRSSHQACRNNLACLSSATSDRLQEHICVSTLAVDRGHGGRPRPEQQRQSVTYYYHCYFRIINAFWLLNQPESIDNDCEHTVQTTAGVRYFMLNSKHTT